MEDLTDSLSAAIQRTNASRAAARAPAIAGLDRIVAAIGRHPHTGQAARLVRFLAGMYSGERFPFDLAQLRGLDADLASACIDVLRYDHFGELEVHKWGVITGDRINALLEAYGLYYEAQKARIAGELYGERYGEAGHPDQGMSA